MLAGHLASTRTTAEGSITLSYKYESIFISSVK
jgi:hypothetical protein